MGLEGATTERVEASRGRDDWRSKEMDCRKKRVVGWLGGLLKDAWIVFADQLQAGCE